MKNYIDLVLIFLFILASFSCGSSEADKLDFAKSNDPISFSALKDNFDDYEGEQIVLEGIVNANCCGKREVPLIDLQEFIYSNGDVVHVALDFKKEDISIVRGFSTGMPIKIVGDVDYMSTDNDFIREIGAKEYYIHIKNCVIIPNSEFKDENSENPEQSNVTSIEGTEEESVNSGDISQEVSIDTLEIKSSTYYHIEDVDGFSNLRDKENGKIIRKVYPYENFKITDSSGSFMKVIFDDGSTGFIHKTRVVKN